jgi:peptidoglycan/xylan/chitin deacetylase (PgdA/CDA1 family)
MSNLYVPNAPEQFWRVQSQPAPTAAEWAAATALAAPVLPPAALIGGDGIDSILAQTLGEGQFGPSHWRLGPDKRVYNALKPLLPRTLTRRMKRFYGAVRPEARRLRWPIEDRYVRFQIDLARHLAGILRQARLPFIDFWPRGHSYAFVLTHDIETGEGQSFVRRVADLDARFGFRSAFNFVPERYAVDRRLMDELRERGFEVGVHGLRHDGRDFSSEAEFRKRAVLINRYVREFGAAGFRAPLTHRNPEWMQLLEIEYDSSFCDTDPYEPMAGGTMSIWPFRLGHFVELPFTLVQDYTLAAVLGETSPRLWLEKVEFLRAHHGLALLNTHPDYLIDPAVWSIYSDFLRAMHDRSDYHHALPRDVARWWRARAAAGSSNDLPESRLGWISGPESASQAGRYGPHTAGARSSAARTA